MARRARAHAEVAAWMAGVAGGRAEEVAELVAHHYSAAVTGDADLAWIDEPDRRDEIAGRRSTRSSSPGRSLGAGTRCTRRGLTSRR